MCSLSGGSLPVSAGAERRRVCRKFFKFQDDGGVRAFLEQQQNPRPGIETYASLIRSCTNTRNLEDGRSLHRHIELDCRFSRDRYLGNLLVEMYGKCGSPDDSRSVFDRILFRNVFSWNMMISAYAQNGHLGEARLMFDSMPQKDCASWSSIITAHAKQGQIDEARKLFEAMEHGSSVVPWNALMSACAEAADFDQVLVLFARMDLEGVRGNEVTFLVVLDACAHSRALELGKVVHIYLSQRVKHFRYDVRLGTAVVNMYGKCGQNEQAKQVFDGMQRKNLITWNSMVAAYAHNGDLVKSMVLFEEVKPEANVVSWNTIIAAHAQNGECKKAIELFTLMDLEGVPADEVTIISVLDACASLSAIFEGRAIHASLCSSHSKLLGDVKVGTALVHLYGKCGWVYEARWMFEAMALRNAVTWNAMVAACAHNGHADEAIALFWSMAVEGLQPDDATLVALLSACSHAGKLADALSFFVNARDDYGFVLCLDHYVCMLDVFSRASWVEEAKDLVKSMPFEPHFVALTAALGHQSDLDPPAVSPKHWDRNKVKPSAYFSQRGNLVF